MSGMREKVARGMYAQGLGKIPGRTWERAGVDVQQSYLRYADAAFDALLDPTAIMVMAPRFETIEGMVNLKDCRTIFTSMIRAAQEGK